jgi:uncharacterized protein
LARSRVSQLLLVAAVGITVVYAVLLFAIWRLQERIVFQPPAGVVPSAVAARQVRYKASDGIELFGYVVGDCAPGSTAVLAFHGNADLSRWVIPWASTVVQETGSCVFLPEYRGYDGIEGVPTYEGSGRDARAALEYLRDTLAVEPANIVYFGHSLGSAIAAELAAVAAPRALVLQSPFSSAREMGRRMLLPGLTLFWRIVSRVHFDTIARVRSVETPVWVSHGDKDFIIPVRMGRDVFAAARRKGELLVVRGAGHNDVAEVGAADYWSWLRRALASTPVLTPAARAETRSEL